MGKEKVYMHMSDEEANNGTTTDKVSWMLGVISLRHIFHKTEHRSFKFQYPYIWCYTCDKCLWVREGKPKPTKPENPITYDCEKCGITYESVLVTGIKKICSDCFKNEMEQNELRKISKYSLKTHKKDKSNPYYCEKCDKIIRIGFNIHMIEQHGKKF